MKNERVYGLLTILWLLIIATIAFLWQLGNTGLVDETEPLFAEAARQMNITGNWITPYFNGETRFDKPPLIYWLMAICYRLIGVNELAVRLPSALAAICLMVFICLTLRYFGDIKAAVAQGNNQGKENLDNLVVSPQLWLLSWIGAALVALNISTIVWGRVGVSDMLLSGCIGSSLLAFFWGYVASDKSDFFSADTAKISDRQSLFDVPHPWFIGFYLFIALAILTKGPVGIVLPGLIIGSFLIYLGSLEIVLRQMKPIFGLILISIVTLPWYVLVVLENGQDYINSFFGYHNFQRFTSVVNGHEGAWYYYFPMVMILFAPWSIYLPHSIIRLKLWKRNYWRKQPRKNHLGVFAAWWFISIFGFFSVSVTKLPSYILPLIPAAAILVTLAWGAGISELSPGKPEGGLLLSIIGNCLLSLLLVIAFWQLPMLLGTDPAIPNLRERLVDTGIPLRGAMVWGLIFGSSLLALIAARRKRWILWLNIFGFMAFVVLVLNPTYLFVDRTRQLPLKKLASTIAQTRQTHEEVWMLGFKKPSLVFFSQQQIRFFKNRNALKAYFNDGNSIEPEIILLVLHERYLKQIRLTPNYYQKVDEQGVYNLIKIAPDDLFLLLQQSST